MSGVSRLPEDYVKIKRYNEEFKPLPDNIEEELKDFHKDYLSGSDEVSIGYADAGAILVRAVNNMVWTKRHHEVFCHHFNLILCSFDRCEHYEPQKYDLELNFLYIPRFDNEYYNEMCSVDINNIRFI